MLTLEQIHEIGRELESIYCLKNAPMAIRLVNRDEEMRRRNAPGERSDRLLV